MTPETELKKAFNAITAEANAYKNSPETFIFNVKLYLVFRQSLLDVETTYAPKGFLKRCLDEIRLDDVEPTGSALDLYLNLIEGRADELELKTVVTFRDWLKEYFNERQPARQETPTNCTRTAYNLPQTFLNASSFTFSVC